MPFRSLHWYPDLGEADPTPQTTEVSVMFRHALQMLNDGPGQHGEIPSVQRKSKVRKTRNQTVEDVVADPQQPSLFPPCALRINNIVALKKLLQQTRDRLGRILQIAVHQHRRIAGYVVQSGCEGCLMPEIPRQRQYDNARVVVRELLQNG